MPQFPIVEEAAQHGDELRYLFKYAYADEPWIIVIGDVAKGPFLHGQGALEVPPEGYNCVIAAHSVKTGITPCGAKWYPMNEVGDGTVFWKGVVLECTLDEVQVVIHCCTLPCSWLP